MERPELLIVDDDPTLLRMLTYGLAHLGYDIATARNGKEALAHVEDRTPEVIILDLEMPVMDGRTFYRELRSRGSQTPVLILSAHDAMGAQREMGADASLNKPFDPEELAVKVAQLSSPS